MSRPYQGYVCPRNRAWEFLEQTETGILGLLDEKEEAADRAADEERHRHFDRDLLARREKERVKYALRKARKVAKSNVA